jgi:hypothetical protein
VKGRLQSAVAFADAAGQQSLPRAVGAEEYDKQASGSGADDGSALSTLLQRPFSSSDAASDDDCSGDGTLSSRNWHHFDALIAIVCAGTPWLLMASSAAAVMQVSKANRSSLSRLMRQRHMIVTFVEMWRTHD